jgi:hypothetical protein
VLAAAAAAAAATALSWCEISLFYNSVMFSVQTAECGHSTTSPILKFILICTYCEPNDKAEEEKLPSHHLMLSVTLQLAQNVFHTIVACSRDEGLS